MNFIRALNANARRGRLPVGRWIPLKPK